MSLSGHKINGPKGVGALYVSKDVRISPCFFGGGQEKGICPGTHNLPAIAGFGLAAKLSLWAMEESASHMRALQRMLLDGISERFPGAHINTPKNAAPHIVNVSFPGYVGENILHYLESKGIFVSVGSACASNKAGKSAALLGMGASKAIAESAIRVSFSHDNKEEDVASLLDALKQALETLIKR